jgi:hypothetical protein
MKRNQKKFSRKNYKGGVVDSNMAKVSLAALKKRLGDIELNLGTIKTKMGEVNPVEGPSREDNTGFEEAGYPVPPIGQSNPMNPNFVSTQSTSGTKIYNGTTPITTGQYDEVDRLNTDIKNYQKDPKRNKYKLETSIGLKNAILAKYKKRVDYLENAQRATPLTQAEIGELDNLKANLNPNEPFGGGRRSRRYRKSKRSTRRKRTRKYKK